MIVGVDIGGHHAAAALVDDSSWTIVTDSYRRVEVERTAGSDELLSSWAGLIDEVADKCSESIAGVGVAMPGPFDYRTGIAYFEGTGKFQSLYGLDVGRELRSRSRHTAEMRFLNDATAFAVGCTGASRDLRSSRILAVTLGTGLGSAFLDSRIPVISDAHGRLPPHGSLWHLPFKDGIADDHLSSRWLLAQGHKVPGLVAPTVADLAAEVRTTGLGRSIFDDYGANLAAIIAPWVKSFECEHIVLGGRITGAFDLFSSSLEAGLEAAQAMRPITVHESTETAAILGAATAFDEDFWSVAKARLPAR
jgi:glucokinase